MARKRPGDPSQDLETAFAGPETTEGATTIRETLRRSGPDAVARTARLIAQYRRTEWGADLAAALSRFLREPAKADKGCRAKLAIVDALIRLDYAEPGAFLQGLAHVQMEPVWGGRVDTAANLRGSCAVALVRLNYPGIRVELASLLMDPEVEARRTAVKACEMAAGEACEAALRLKARAGDEDPDVVAGCLAALMRLNPDRSLGFVAAFLDAEDGALFESAALALGDSRLSGAFPVLTECWRRNIGGERRKPLVLALSLTRCDEAFEFLLELVDSGSRELAAEAASALRIYTSEKHRARTRAALAARGDAALTAAFEAPLSGQ